MLLVKIKSLFPFEEALVLIKSALAHSQLLLLIVFDA